VGSPSPTRAATTTQAVINAPMDRSNSPDTMTNSSPSAATSNGAQRLRNAIRDGGSANDGSRQMMTASATARTSQIGGTERSRRNQSGAAAVGTAVVSSSVVMRSPGLPGRRT